MKNAILRAFVALTITLPLVACGSEETPSAAATEKAPEPLISLPVGKGYAVEGFEFWLSSAKQKRQIGTPGIGPKAGGEEIFLSAHVALKNVGKEPADRVNFPKFELIDASGQVYAEDREASTVEGMLNDAHSGALNPGVTARLVSVWKVNKSAFDPKTWKVKVTFDQGLNANLQKAARWPLETTFPAPVLLELK